MKNYFKTQEFVPKEIYQVWGENSKWFVDKRIWDFMNFLRGYFGKSIIINNWLWGGVHNYRGFRPPEATVGANLSQHRFGRGVDATIVGMTPKQVYDAILANPKPFLDKGLTTMEDIADTPAHNHFDCRYTGEPNIKIVKP